MFSQNVFKLSLLNKTIFFQVAEKKIYLTLEQWNCALWKDYSCVRTLKKKMPESLLSESSVQYLSIFSSDRLGT